MKKIHAFKINAILHTIKQLCSIIFPMITFPFATRVLGKYYFGKVNFGASIISYITLIAGLGINSYAIREGSKIRDDRKKLQKLTNEIFSINIISMLIGYTMLIVVSLIWNRLNGYEYLLIIQSMTVLFTTMGTDWLNSIHEDYLYITIRYIICQAISLVLMLLFVQAPEDYLIYAMTTVSGGILANISNMVYVRKKYKLSPRFTIQFKPKLHLKPILILFATSLAAFIYVNSDITILGILKDENEVGVYSLSAKVYSLVKQLTNALFIVAIPRISYEISNKNIKDVKQKLETLLGETILLLFPACVGLFMLSKQIVIIIGGNEYISSIQPLQYLSIALFFATMVTFYAYVVMIPFKKEKESLLITTVSAVVNIVLNFLLIPLFGGTAAAFTTLISEMLSAIMAWFCVRKILSINVYKFCIIGLLNGIVTFVICYLITNLYLSTMLTVVLSIFLCLISCAIIYFLCTRKFINL